MPQPCQSYQKAEIRVSHINVDLYLICENNTIGWLYVFRISFSSTMSLWPKQYLTQKLQHKGTRMRI